MILGTGVDIVEIGRIVAAARNPRFTHRVFTLQEQDYCESKKTQKYSSYAARFAAKEAVMKALGTGLSQGKWQDIEIVSSTDNKPHVRLHGFFAAVALKAGVREIHVSLAHSREYAVAQAMTWGSD